MPTLVIADKNYSSWSMRPWVLMHACGLAFDEHLIRLAEPDTAARIRAVSPSGRVPALIDGETVVWDSLAIIETLAERYPLAGIWPANAAARAHARAISAEMHAGFAALRSAMPMNIRARHPGAGHTPEAMADVARIVELWTDALQRWGGPFLMGTFSAADAMYAPVVMRFITYGVALPPACEAYVAAVAAHPAVAAWVAAALADPRRVARYDNVYGGSAA